MTIGKMLAELNARTIKKVNNVTIKYNIVSIISYLL